MLIDPGQANRTGRDHNGRIGRRCANGIAASAMTHRTVSQVLASPGPGPRVGALARKFAAIGAATDVPFAVILASGAVLRSGKADPSFTLRFHSARAERRVLAIGYVGLLEAYFDGSVEIDGDLAAPFRAGFAGGLDVAVNPLIALRNRATSGACRMRRSRRPRPTRASTTASARISTVPGSTCRR